MDVRFAKVRLSIAAFLAASAPALAQDGADGQTPEDAISDLVEFDPANWQLVRSEAGNSYLHKASGAACFDSLHDLELTAIVDFAPDGTNSGCQYDKIEEQKLNRLTVYVYTAEGLTGSMAYNEAKNVIRNLGKNTAITVTERGEEGQKCHQAIVPPLSKAILDRMEKEGLEGEDSHLGLGLMMYDIAIPEIDGRPAVSQTSMLSVYQTGRWVVKSRVTVPKGETSFADACNYGGFASVGLANVINRQKGSAFPNR